MSTKKKRTRDCPTCHEELAQRSVDAVSFSQPNRNGNCPTRIAPYLSMSSQMGSKLPSLLDIVVGHANQNTQSSCCLVGGSSVSTTRTMRRGCYGCFAVDWLVVHLASHLLYRLPVASFSFRASRNRSAKGQSYVRYVPLIRSWL